ncbi:MAG: tRNA lysidine(34) synthetase TilS, partial [Dehalococcoidia bacterium]|nr:tRNA lysidine(34) synthetase TilS [Dehalococcoidia bacterium]
RATIETYCAARALPVCRDHTNDEPTTLRNRLRRVVVPALKAENPAIANAVVRLTEALAAQNAFIADHVAAILPTPPSGPARSVEWTRLTAQPPALQAAIVRRLCEDDGLNTGPTLSAAQVSTVLRLPPNGVVPLPGGWRARRVSGLLQIERRSEPSPLVPTPSPVTLSVDDGRVERPWCVFGRWRVRAVRQLCDDPGVAPVVGWRRDVARYWGWVAHPGPFTVRAWRPGDRYRQLGAPGNRKLQDVFTDAKTPAAARRSWPVFCVGDAIVWTPGARVAESYRARIGAIGTALVAEPLGAAPSDA